MPSSKTNPLRLNSFFCFIIPPYERMHELKHNPATEWKKNAKVKNTEADGSF